MLNYQLFLLLFFISLNNSAVAGLKKNQFQNKYLFVHSSHYNIKEYNDVFSPCFKINEESKKLLKNYLYCAENKLPDENKSIGRCKKNKPQTQLTGYGGPTADAYFFESKLQCENGRDEIMSTQG